MANKKISAFDTITTIPGGPITLNDVLGVAGYCDDPAAPGTDVNVSFSGADIIAATGGLPAVLAVDDTATTGQEIKILDFAGFNPITFKATGIESSPLVPINITSQGHLILEATSNNTSASLYNNNGVGTGNILIRNGQSNGELELETAGELKITLPVAPTGAGDVLTAKNVSGDVEWTTPSVATSKGIIVGAATNPGEAGTSAANPRQVHWSYPIVSSSNYGPCMPVTTDMTVTDITIKWPLTNVPTIGVGDDVNFFLAKLTSSTGQSDTQEGTVNYTLLQTLTTLNCTNADSGTIIYKTWTGTQAFTAGEILLIYFSRPPFDWSTAGGNTGDFIVSMGVEYT